MTGEQCRVPEPIQEVPMINKRENLSKKDYLRRYEITINCLSTGANVRIGCKTIGFSTISQMLNALNDYFENPEEEVKKWYEKFESEE